MNVLFICTGNSARSLIAEAVLNGQPEGRHQAFSVGSRPAGEPHRDAIRVLVQAGYATSTLRSKSWDEFSAEAAVRPDVVITLCDTAAAEECPAWIGTPPTLHWGLPDPAAVENPADRQKAFERILAEIERRVADFMRV